MKSWRRGDAWSGSVEASHQTGGRLIAGISARHCAPRRVPWGPIKLSTLIGAAMKQAHVRRTAPSPFHERVSKRGPRSRPSPCPVVADLVAMWSRRGDAAGQHSGEGARR